MPIRVDWVTSHISGKLGLVFRAYPSPHPLRCWDADYFRKIRPASDEFTRKVRACKPIREDAHAL